MSSDNIEDFGYGITRHWRHDKRMVIIGSEGNMAREAVDRWAEVIIQTLDEWGDHSPMLVLLDLSSPKQGITPYSMHRAEQAYSHVPDSPDLKVYAAAVLSNNILTRLASVFLRRQRGKHRNVTERIFTKMEEAESWLENFLT